MKVTFQVSSSGVCTDNVVPSNIDTHLHANDQYRDEALALCDFMEEDGIPEKFSDSDSEGEWVKCDEYFDIENEIDFYTYEFRERKFSAYKNSTSEPIIFDSFSEAARFLSGSECYDIDPSDWRDPRYYIWEHVEEDEKVGDWEDRIQCYGEVEECFL